MGKYDFNPAKFRKPQATSSSASSSSGEPSEPQFSICNNIIIPKDILEFFLNNPEYGSDNDILLDFIGSFQKVYETKKELFQYVLYNLNRLHDLKSLGFVIIRARDEIEIMTKIKEICLKQDKDKTIEDYFVIYDIQDDLCPNMYTRIYPDLFTHRVEPKVEVRNDISESNYEFQIIRNLNSLMDRLSNLSRGDLVNYVTNFYNRIEDRINPNWLNNSRVNKPWYFYKNHQLKYNIYLQLLYDQLTENNKKRLKNVVMRLRQGTLVREQMTDTGPRPMFRNFNDEEMKFLINEAKKLFSSQFSLAELNSDFEVDSASASASASAGPSASFPSASARPSASASDTPSTRPSASDTASASAGPNDTTISSIIRMERRSPYAILGLPEGASRSDIKKAYFNLARIVHPDKNVDNEENATKAFKIISNAKDELLPSEGGSKKRKSIKKKKTSKKRKSLKKRKTLRK